MGRKGIGEWVDAQALHLCWEYGVYLVLGIVFSTPVAQALGKKIQSMLSSKDAFYYLRSGGELLLFCWAVSFVLLGSYNPFIYFNF